MTEGDIALMVSIVCRAAAGSRTSGMCYQAWESELLSLLTGWRVRAPHNGNDKVSSGVTEARTDHFTQNFGFLTRGFIDFSTIKTS